MKKGLNTFGFTLVELMVVIAIIGILATLILVTLDNTKSTARNTRRLADIKELQLALKLYYNDNGFYPTAITAGTSISRNGVNYLLRVPENPKPWGEGNCSEFNSDYQYKQLEGGKRYSLRFCVTEKTDDLSSGTKLATANGILDCPAGYIGVPGSATFETNDFCVMQYEAKCASNSNLLIGLSPAIGSGASSPSRTYDNTYAGNACTAANSRTPVSTPSGWPITKINQPTAKLYCESIGGHLITNPEWMTIARNVEQVGVNWWAGIVGTNSLALGHYGYAIGQTLDGSEVFSGTVLYGKTSPQVFTPIYKRELYLSSGDKIIDFSGNVAEWVDAQCTQGNSDGQYSNINQPWDYSDSSSPNLAYERTISGPSSSSYGNSHGVGTYRGCTATGNVFLRGGWLNGGNNDGIFDLDLSRNSSFSDPLVGFRCVK